MNTKRMIDYWVIPPESNAEFVACMEEVLETYEKPYDPAHPVICMDEQPVQLIKEVREPIEATAEHPKRVDYEYERNGDGEHLHVLRTPLRVSTSNRTVLKNQGRLGVGSRRVAGHPIWGL